MKGTDISSSSPHENPRMFPLNLPTRDPTATFIICLTKRPQLFGEVANKTCIPEYGLGYKNVYFRALTLHVQLR